MLRSSSRVSVSMGFLLCFVGVQSGAWGADPPQATAEYFRYAQRFPCGDHSILGDPHVSRLLDTRCEPGREDQNRLIIDRLNPEMEATNALKRGDRRVGTLGIGFPLRAGEHPWETPGLVCPKITPTELFYFSGTSDTASTAKIRLEESYRSFLFRYNARLLILSQSIRAQCTATDVEATK